MAMNFVVALRVFDAASAPLRRMATAGDLMSSSANRLSVAAKAANSVLTSLAVGTGAISGAMVIAGAKVEQSLARLSTATETTSTSLDFALNNAEKSARDFSTKYSASVDEILAAQFRLATAGVAVSEQIEAVQGAYKFATATAGDFLTASELLGSFLNTFGKSIELNYLAPGEKVAKITDVMSAAVQKYQLDMNNLNDSLKFLVGPASTLGLSISETTAFAGALNTAGFRGTLAGTAISNAFNKINIATEKLDLDPSRFTDAGGNLKSFASFLDEVERKTAGMTSIEKQNKYIEVFDIRAGRAIGTLIQMKNSVVQFAMEMDVASGVTERLANIMENTTGAKLQQLGNAFTNIGSAIGMAMNEPLKVVIDGLKGIVAAGADFVSSNRSLVGITLITVTALSSLIVILITASLMWGKLSAAVLANIAANNAFLANTAKSAVALLRLLGAVSSLVAGYAAWTASIWLASWAIQGMSNDSSSALEKIAYGFTAVIGITGSLAAALLALKGAYASLLPWLTKLGGAIRTLAASFTILNVVVNGTMATLSRFAKHPVVLIILAALAVIGTAIYALKNALDSIAESKKPIQNLKDYDKTFQSLRQRVATATAEIERLSKVTEKDIRLNVSTELGKAPFAVKAFEARKKDPSLTAKQALDDSIKTAGGGIGGFIGILTEYEDRVIKGSISLVEFGKQFDSVASTVSAAYNRLDDAGKAFMVMRTSVEATTRAYQALGDGTEASIEIIERLSNMMGSMQNINDMTTAVKNTKLQELFDLISTSAEMMKNSTVKSVRDIGNEFIELRSAWEAAGITDVSTQMQSPEFLKFATDSRLIGALSTDIEDVTSAFQQLGLAMYGIQSPESQMMTVLNSIGNQFQFAKLGVTDYAKAVEESSKKLEEAQGMYDGFVAGLENARRVISMVESMPNDELRRAIEASTVFQDLKLMAGERGDETKIKLLLSLDERTTQVTQKKILGLLDQTKDKFVVKARETLAEIIESSFIGVLSGENDLSEAMTKMGSDIKNSLFGSVKESISLAIADPFKGELAAMQKGIQDLTLQFATEKKFKIGMDTGDFNRQLQGMAEKVAPNLVKIFKIDFRATGLEKNVKKLAESYNDIMVDSTVKSLTASSENASAMGELNRIMSQGAFSGDALKAQINDLSNLAIRAQAAGADEALSLIESALSAAYKKLFGDQDQVGRLSSATDYMQQAIDTSAQKLATAAYSFPDAAREAVDIMSSGISGSMRSFRSILGSTFSIADAALRESFKSGATEASVKATTAVGVEANMLADIAKILRPSEGESLTNIIAKLQNTIVSANSLGADSVKAIGEEALRSINKFVMSGAAYAPSTVNQSAYSDMNVAADRLTGAATVLIDSTKTGSRFPPIDLREYMIGGLANLFPEPVMSDKPAGWPGMTVKDQPASMSVNDNLAASVENLKQYAVRLTTLEREQADAARLLKQAAEAQIAAANAAKAAEEQKAMIERGKAILAEQARAQAQANAPKQTIQKFQGESIDAIDALRLLQMQLKRLEFVNNTQRSVSPIIAANTPDSQIPVEISLGDRNIVLNVSVNGRGPSQQGTKLFTRSEVEALLDKAKRELNNDMQQQLRNLEQKLKEATARVR